MYECLWKLCWPWDEEPSAASFYTGPDSLLGRQPVTLNEYLLRSSQPVERKGLVQLESKSTLCALSDLFKYAYFEC